MCIHSGFFKVSRGWADHSVVGPRKSIHRYVAWLYLLEAANYAAGHGYYNIPLEQGQLSFSNDRLVDWLNKNSSDRKYWTAAKVKSFLGDLEAAKMVEIQTLTLRKEQIYSGRIPPGTRCLHAQTKFRVLTICNYSVYQNGGDHREENIEVPEQLNLGAHSKDKEETKETKDIYMDFRDIWNDLVSRHSATMVQSRKPTDDHKKHWKRHIKSGLTLADFRRALEAAEASGHWILGENEGWRNKTTIMNLLRGNHIQDLLDLADDAESAQPKAEPERIDYSQYTDAELRSWSWTTDAIAELRSRSNAK